METAVLDIINLIHQQLNFKDQMNWMLVSKFFLRNCPITNMYDGIHNKQNLTTSILKHYPYLTGLDLSFHNIRFIDLNHLTKLRILGAETNRGVRNTSI